jgi:D-amino-acid oxidase
LGIAEYNCKHLPFSLSFGGLCTVSVNAPKYLLYLQEKVLALGAIIKHGTIPSLKALAQIPHGSSKADVIVNCSGLGSRQLGGVLDHQMFPTRGQIVIVKVADALWPQAKQFTCVRFAEGSAMGKGTITYVIPRMVPGQEAVNGEIVLGGTMQHWDW